MVIQKNENPIFIRFSFDLCRTGFQNDIPKLIPANAVECKLEPFAGLGMVGKELHRCIADTEQLLLVLNERNDRLALGNAVAEQTAEAHNIAANGVICIGRTGFDASAAEIALAGIHGNLAVGDRNRAGAARLLTDAAPDAVGFPPCHLHRALDAEIVFLGFQAIVLASGDAEFELVRKLAGEIMRIQLLGKCKGVNTAAGTNCLALTGGHGADSGTAGTGFHAALRQRRFDLVDLAELDERNFDALPRGQMHMPVTVFCCNLCDFRKLLCTDIAADNTEPQRKTILLLLPHEAALF